MSSEKALAPDQEHPDAGHIEQERREIEVSSLRDDHLRWVTRKAKREPQSDELRMPHREERGGMDGSGAYEYGIGRDSR
jgi:hypothetical protein